VSPPQIKLIGKVFLLLTLFYLPVEGIAPATATQKLSLEQLAREADLIAMGRIQGVTSQESADRSTITTVVTFSVEEQWKGPKASTITVKQPGGSVGGLTQRVMGEPQFSVGEEVILFLKKGRDGPYVTVGGVRGKFLIKKDLQSSKRVIEDLTGKSDFEESFTGRLREILGH